MRAGIQHRGQNSHGEKVKVETKQEVVGRVGGQSETGRRELARHIKMDQTSSEVEKEGVMERVEVWKSSHDEMGSAGP